MNQIKTLDDLRKAKKELAFRRQVIKQELRNKLGFVQRNTGGFILKKMLLPAGLGLVTSLVVKHLFGDQDSEKKVKSQQLLQVIDRFQRDKDKWLGYVNIFLSVVKAFQGIRAQRRSVSEMEMTTNGQQLKAENVEMN